MPNFNLKDEVFMEAASRFPTPFYLYDESGIRKTARDLLSAFAFDPGFRQYFAVKALPNPHILRILLSEGMGLDCSSHSELLLAQKAGATGKDVMFSANAMPPAEFALARQMGAAINLDDPSDIALLQHHGGIPDTISLRLNPDLSFQRGSIMGGAEDSKFGMLESQALPALTQLAALGVERFGLHAMAKSNSLDPAYLGQLAAYLFAQGKQLSHQTGLPFAFVNLSGGVGIPYRPEDTPVDIFLAAQQVQAARDTAFPRGNPPSIKTELGRFVTGPHGFLVTRATHRKNTGRAFIGLDASASDLLRPAMYGAYHHATVVNKRDWPHDQVYDLTGALCENNDKFAIMRPLPKIELGDLLFLHDAGAHSHAMGYQYNGRLRSAEVLYTKDGDFRLIRRAETPEDYFATLVE